MRCYAHPAENKPCEPLTIDAREHAVDGRSRRDGKTLAVRIPRPPGAARLGRGDRHADARTAAACRTRAAAGRRPSARRNSTEFVCDPPPAWLDGWGPVRFAPDGRALYVAAQRGQRVTALPRVAERTWSARRRDVRRLPRHELRDQDRHRRQGDRDHHLAATAATCTSRARPAACVSLTADRMTGALSAPRCTLVWGGTASCPESIGGGARAAARARQHGLGPHRAVTSTRTDVAGDGRYAITRFLRTSRPPGGGNRAPLCTDADTSARPGETVELDASLRGPGRRPRDAAQDARRRRAERARGCGHGRRRRAGVETVGFRRHRRRAGLGRGVRAGRRSATRRRARTARSACCGAAAWRCR